MPETDRLIVGADGRARCFWHGGLPEYQDYHDREWGRPVADDFRLFEKICLEGFQSGLSWLTILRKRENFRRAFAGFDFRRVARFGEKDVARLLADAGIVRHRGKIESTINNAKHAIALTDEFGSLARYFWEHEPGAKARPEKLDWETLRAMSRRRSRLRSRRTSRSAAGVLSAPPPSTPSCRRWDWSTTTSKAASAGRRWSASGARSSGRSCARRAANPPLEGGSKPRSGFGDGVGGAGTLAIRGGCPPPETGFAGFDLPSSGRLGDLHLRSRELTIGGPGKRHAFLSRNPPCRSVRGAAR